MVSRDQLSQNGKTFELGDNSRDTEAMSGLCNGKVKVEKHKQDEYLDKG